MAQISDVGNSMQAQNVLNIDQSMEDFENGAVTVTSTQVELKAGSIAMHQRWKLIVFPPTTGTIYWGKSGVTTATGIPLSAGDTPVEFDMLPKKMVNVYAVSDGTNRDVRVLEVK